MFALIVNVYKDQHLLPRLLDQIKNHCPNNPVIIIADGVELLHKQHIWFECTRVKSEGCGGSWTRRYLEYFLEYTNCDHLLRIDPDTCIWRSFTLPEGDYDIFGNISQKYQYPYVRGGCIGFTRECAQKILESKLLSSRNYAKFNYSSYGNHEKFNHEPLAFQDWIIADVGYRLNLKLKEWDEICIYGNWNAIPKKENYAITHPHLNLDEEI